MRTLITLGIIGLLSSISIGSATEKECTKAQVALVADTTFQVNHMLADNELVIDEKTGARIYGYNGTGWRHGKRTIATIEHLVVAMKLEFDIWKPITLSSSPAEYGTPTSFLKTEARLVYLDPTEDNVEGGALIEIADDFPDWVEVVKVRPEPLKKDEPVMSIGYTNETLRFATGALNFPEPSESDEGRPEEPSAYLPFELADNDKTDRLAMDHGASGGPIFDCDGEVVAMIANVRTQEAVPIESMKQVLQFLKNSGIQVEEELLALDRVSSSWGQYNVLGLPVAYFPAQEND
jgi:hypothetical protein